MFMLFMAFILAAVLSADSSMVNEDMGWKGSVCKSKARSSQYYFWRGCGADAAQFEMFSSVTVWVFGRWFDARLAAAASLWGGRGISVRDHQRFPPPLLAGT